MPRWQILKPFEQRDARLLYAGQFVSMLGDGVFTVALAWQVYDLSASPADLSVVLLARTVPLLVLLLFAGVVTDRLPRRGIVLMSDAVRCVTAAVMTVLIVTDTATIANLAGLSAVFGAADAFFFPAYTALIPEVVEREWLMQANAAEATLRPIATRLAGPALGGVLVAAFGTDVALGLDAGTFAISALFLALMRARPAPPGERTGMLREIVEGFRYASSQAWIWVTMVAAAISLLFAFGAYEVLLPLIVKQEMGRTADVYGWIVAASGAGGVVGALVTSRWTSGRRVALMYLAWGTGVLTFSVAAVSRFPLLTAAAGFTCGFLFELGTVYWVTLLQELVPERLLGRVRALDFLVSYALLPASYALVGPLADRLGPTKVLLVGSLVGGGVWFVGLMLPRVRDPDRTAVPAS